MYVSSTHVDIGGPSPKLLSSGRREVDLQRLIRDSARDSKGWRYNRNDSGFYTALLTRTSIAQEAIGASACACGAPIPPPCW